MNTTTIRLPEMFEQFLSQSENNASEIARRAIEEQFYNEMAGVCAVCGDVVFISDGHTNVSTSTPLGRAIEPSEPVDEFDLCVDCTEDAHGMMAKEEPTQFELGYLQENGVYLYSAIRNAIADLGEGERMAWSDLGPSSSDENDPLQATCNRMPEQVLGDLIRWANWKESVSESPSDGLDSFVNYTVEELLTAFEPVTIGFLYEGIRANDLIEDGVIPETAEKTIEQYSEDTVSVS